MAIENITQEQTNTADAVKKLDEKSKQQQEEMKAAQDAVDSQSITDQANQKLAAAMYDLEDTVVEFRKKLDSLLGKASNPKLDPDSKQFDLNASMASVNKLTTPLNKMTLPLASIGGQVPIVGNIASMMPTISKSAASTNSVKQEDIEKMVPTMPEPSPTMVEEIGKIKEDINSICFQLPLIYINVLFQMVKVIYDKLKIITSEIPLGSFFPLNLVDISIQSVPTAKQFVTNAPGEVKNMALGAVKKVQAAQATLAVPQPPAKIPAQTTSSSSSTTNDSSSSSSNQQSSSSSTPKIEPSPVTSSVPTIEATPPMPQPSKTLEEIEDKWKADFKKLNLLVFDTLNEDYCPDGLFQFLSLVPRYPLDGDAWEHIRKSVEYDQSKNPERVDGILKNLYHNFTNKSSPGYSINLLPDYRGHDENSTQDSKQKYVLNDDGKKGKYIGTLEVIPKDLMDEIRLKDGDDTVSEHVSDIKSDTRYKAQQKNIDAGLAKYGKFLGKYYYVNQDELPNFNKTLLLGKHKYKGLDD